MDGDVQAFLLLQLVEGNADLFNGFVTTIEGAAHNRNHANGVLITQLHSLFSTKVIALPFHRDETRLDIPIATEFLPTYLYVDAHDEIRPVCRFASSSHALSPSP